MIKMDKVNKIVAKYNDDEQTAIYNMVYIMRTLKPTGAPETEKEFSAWCEKYLAERAKRNARKNRKRA